MELSDELYAQITKHTDIGEHYFEEGKFRKALEEYKKAFDPPARAPLTPEVVKSTST